MEQDEKRNALYAIPCKLDEDDNYEEFFFLTFNTRNEKEAMRLASCVTPSKKSLVIITEDGEYYDCS